MAFWLGPVLVVKFCVQLTIQYTAVSSIPTDMSSPPEYVGHAQEERRKWSQFSSDMVSNLSDKTFRSETKPEHSSENRSWL